MYSEANYHRIEVGYKNPELDPAVNRLKSISKKNFGIIIRGLEIVRVFSLKITARDQQIAKIAEEVLTDRVIQRSAVNTQWTTDYDFVIEKKFKPGITDNEAKTAREQIGLLLGRKLREDEIVTTSTIYIIKGMKEQDAGKLASTIANNLIHEVAIYKKGEWPKTKPVEYSAPASGKIEFINLDEVLEGDAASAIISTKKTYWELLGLDAKELKQLGLKKRIAKDDDLKKLSDKMTLSLTAQELKIFRDYFEKPAIKKKRGSLGLKGPTDVELEAFAQTQSEHCKHKIFNANIQYKDKAPVLIKSLFRTYIKAATDEISKKRRDLISVFKDNAGIISFDEKNYVCFKVETHNAPSALDPFGGAETGIVGVNRDVLGAGLGAKPVANTDVFCLANPFYKGSLPPGVLHPWRIFEGVREGVESGGNKSGIPTVNGSYFFDQKYLGRPLVFCGTIGLMPKKASGKDTSTKKAKPGDKIVMAGGRIGKDGIHGATFSSAELNEGSPMAAVQIGDPITQKKMSDALLEARDLGLIESVTDNGAGGLSSSVGEMALQAGGCEFDLSLAPLKYPGLSPWEILLSEAQERMTLAISPKNLEAFLELMRSRAVECAVLGEFTASGIFHAKYGSSTVAYIDLSFLHDGLPPMKLEADNPEEKILAVKKRTVQIKSALLELLSDLTICSKEYTIRQYDHEVQARTIVKPLVGADGPSDAAVLKLLYDSWKGLVVSNGLCPSIVDSYAMAQCALDEAVRNAVCVGADPKSIVVLDNFCWPDPVQSASNPDGRQKLGKLVQACMGLKDAAVAYQTPFISGKDSMKNDFRYISNGRHEKISILPTILISAIGTIKDVRQAVTMDVKCPGDLVYVAGITKDDISGSRFQEHFGGSSPHPSVDLKTAMDSYEKIHLAIMDGLVASCHDCSDGGLGVALAESALAGNLGIDADLSKVPVQSALDDEKILFSETPSRLVITVPKLKQKLFEKKMTGVPLSIIGVVKKQETLTIKPAKGKTVSWTLAEIKSAWKKPFGGTDEA